MTLTGAQLVTNLVSFFLQRLLEGVAKELVTSWSRDSRGPQARTCFLRGDVTFGEQLFSKFPGNLDYLLPFDGQRGGRAANGISFSGAAAVAAHDLSKSLQLFAPRKCTRFFVLEANLQQPKKRARAPSILNTTMAHAKPGKRCCFAHEFIFRFTTSSSHHQALCRVSSYESTITGTRRRPCASRVLREVDHIGWLRRVHVRMEPAHGFEEVDFVVDFGEEVREIVLRRWLQREVEVVEVDHI